MKKFLITEGLAQSILNYLAEKPFKESAMLIQNLQRLEPFEEPKEADAKPKKQKDKKEPEPQPEKVDDDKGD